MGELSSQTRAIHLCILELFIAALFLMQSKGACRAALQPNIYYK